MTADLYCSRADLYRYGLARGLLGASARLVAASVASTDEVELDGHGFETDDQIAFRATEGGTLSAPLVAGATYYAVRVNDSLFKVAATAGGSAIDLTSNGVSMLVAMALPFDDVIEFYSRWADNLLPAAAVPLDPPIPVIVRGLVAELSAKKLMQLAGHTSASIDAAELSAKAQLERFASGLPVRDATVKPTNKAVTASLVVTGRDPRGWGSGVLP